MLGLAGQLPAPRKAVHSGSHHGSQATGAPPHCWCRRSSGVWGSTEASPCTRVLAPALGGDFASGAFEQEEPRQGWAHLPPASPRLPQWEAVDDRTPLPHVQDRRQCLAAALEQLMQTCPADMDHEKTQLLLIMLLAKKIADHSPALLRDIFRTTVTFINQNLITYVRNLVQNVRASGG